MVIYRRNRITGGTYFFPVILRDRKSTVLIERIDLLRTAFRAVKRSQPFRIDAMVILPEHLHAVWTLPPEDNDYSGRWRAIKAQFTRTLAPSGHRMARNPKGEYDLWQRRFWEHTIRDDEDLRRHVEYIHFNPVKHGHVARVGDWPYSTFHRYVRLGVCLPDWAGEAEDDAGVEWGE